MPRVIRKSESALKNYKDYEKGIRTAIVKDLKIDPVDVAVYTGSFYIKVKTSDDAKAIGNYFYAKRIFKSVKLLEPTGRGLWTVQVDLDLSKKRESNDVPRVIKASEDLQDRIAMRRDFERRVRELLTRINVTPIGVTLLGNWLHIAVKTKADAMKVAKTYQATRAYKSVEVMEPTVKTITVSPRKNWTVVVEI